MPAVNEARLRQLLQPFAVREGVPYALSERLISQFAAYLDLLVRWNSRTNLTAVRNPEQMVTRHLGESLFAGLCLSPYLEQGAAVLDFGSGAGLPGIPIQILHPHIRVTLAESQGKKAAFLREVVRALELPSSVWSKRAELLPQEERFDVVMLRAVDNMENMREVGLGLLSPGGVLLEMGGDALEGDVLWRMPTRVQSMVAIRRKAAPLLG